MALDWWYNSGGILGKREAISGVMPPLHRSVYITPGEGERLKEIAKAKGYVVDRGPHRGEGSISKLLKALAEGEVTAIRLGGKNDRDND